MENSYEYKAGFNAGKKEALRNVWGIVEKEHSDAMKQLQPILDALNAPANALLEVQSVIEEELEVSSIGRCETCRKPLFEGDQGYSYSDDCIMFCAQDAPTYQDIQNELTENPESYEDQEHRDRVQSFLDKHLASGGKLSDTYSYTL